MRVHQYIAKAIKNQAYIKLQPQMTGPLKTMYVRVTT